MLKKAKAADGEGGRQPATAKDLAQAVLDSSHQIWLAGLGAFSQAQQEGTEGVRDAGEAGRAAARTGRSRPPPRRRPRRAAPRRQRRRRCSRWRAERGTSWSRCSRTASRGRCRSSASTRRTTCSASPTRVDELVGGGQQALKAPAAKAPAAKREAKPAKRRAQGSARANRGEEAGKRAREGRRGSRATASRCGPPLFAVQLLDLLDVVLHRLVLAHSLELGPGVVLRAADEIEAARAARPSRRLRSPACSTNRA